MIWKTRTRTKIIVIALIWIGLLITFLVIGLPLLSMKYPQLVPYRENISTIIVSLTMGGAGMFVFHVLTVSNENVKKDPNLLDKLKGGN